MAFLTFSNTEPSRVAIAASVGFSMSFAHMPLNQSPIGANISLILSHAALKNPVILSQTPLMNSLMPLQTVSQSVPNQPRILLAILISVFFAFVNILAMPFQTSVKTRPR